METKSPTTSLKLREIIGVDQFAQRREVFGKYDTVFLPLPSPTNTTRSIYKEVDPIITSNHGKTTSNFKRNAPAYSSMRESREDYNLDFRPRKYSDNFTSELNQNDEVDYRRSLTERTRRLSKMRRDFLNSNLHEPNTDSAFARSGVRASMPATSINALKYKIESPNLYKFPFAEPYSTPPPVRKVVVDLGPAQVNGEKENEDPESKPKPRHQSMPGHESSPPSKIDHQKLFEELVKRYSPQRKPVNWNLPPTRPRVVGSVPKSTSSTADEVEIVDKKILDEAVNKFGEDDVFEKKEKDMEVVQNSTKTKETADATQPNEKQHENSKEKQDALEATPTTIEKEKDTEIPDTREKQNELPQLLTVPEPEDGKRKSMDKFTDLTIPALIEKMTEEAKELENHKKENKKVKRKRSFLDKLLRRKKEK